MIIHSHKEIQILRQTIALNASKTFLEIKNLLSDLDPISFFARLKFEKIGADPIAGTAMNTIEQINQMFSALVVLEATDRLLYDYPDKVFDVQLGVTSGFDIESTDGSIAAECFAVTTSASNNKLVKDSKRLMDNCSAAYRYVFFYANDDCQEKLEKIYSRFPQITYVRIEGFETNVPL